MKSAGHRESTGRPMTATGRRALVFFICCVMVFCLPLSSSARGKSRKYTPRSRRAPAHSVKQQEKVAFVNVPYSSVFGRGSESAEHVTEVLLGDEFRVIGESDGWYYGYIPSQKDYRGWIRAGNLLFTTSAPATESSTYVIVKSAQTMLTLRDGSSMTVFAGTRLPMLKNHGWRYEVLLPDGSRAYLPADSSSPEKGLAAAEISPNDILAASKFNQADYKWGGITSGGMDCSGFVYTSFRINGIFLKRDSYLQAEEGSDVSADQLQPADLVFFRTSKAKRISHVGIYIGNGNFIHSSRSKKGVAISSLSDEPFKHMFAGARRILSRPSKTVRNDSQAAYFSAVVGGRT